MKAAAAKTIALLVLALAAAGCRQDMFEEPKYKPLVESSFYVDGRSARPVPPGTFAYGVADEGDAIERGVEKNGDFVAGIPLPVDETLLRRGRERFDIYCSPCHGRLGDGNGTVAKRGFKIPADLNSARVRNAPPGYLYAVIENGYGAMPDYEDQVDVHDRWAIVAYIRALELSRSATLADAPPQARARLEGQP